MTNNPLVSIIIPVYNSEKYLKRCLDSVINQTLQEIEIICIDDCSTDNSPKILKKYQEKDSRIKIIQNKTNKKQGYSRNLGVIHSHGRYISFVDSDDSIKENMLEILLERILKDDTCIVICNYSKPLNNLVINHFKEGMTKEDVFKGVLSRKLSASPCNKLYKKELIVKNNISFPEGRYYEDSAIACLYIFFSKKISIIEESLYYYYDNKNSTTRFMTANHIKDISFTINYIKRFLINKGIYNKYKNEYDLMATRLISYIVNKLAKFNANQDILENLSILILSLINKSIEKKGSLQDKKLTMIYSLASISKKSNHFIKYLNEHIKDKSILNFITNLPINNLGVSYYILQSILNKPLNKLYLYGSGEIAEKIIPVLEAENIKILGILDSNPQDKNELLGYPIYSSKDFDYQNTQEHFVVASESSAYEITQFLETKINRDKVINFYS